MAKDQQHPVLYLAAFLFVSYIIYNRLSLYITRRRIIKQHGCLPNPHQFNKDPILGLDALRINIHHAKNRSILDAQLRRYEQYKSNTFMSRMMTMPMISTIEPENVKTVLSLKFKDYSFGARKQAFAPLLGNGIFNADGERWANSRHLLRPNFAREQVADLVAFERHMQLLLKALKQKNGQVLDLQEYFFRFTIDTATEFLFNHSTASLRMMVEGTDNEKNEDAVFAKAFTVAQADVLTRIRLGFLDKFRQNKEGNDAIKICHEYVEQFVDDAIRWREEKDAEKAAGAEKEEERYVFIHELAKQTNDKKRIRDELTNVLLAGRDTTASLLSNMFFEISSKPEIWKKLREEVATLDGRLPTYEELKNMKYLKWCLNESLRIHPVVPGNSRYAIRDTVLPLGGGPDGKAPLFVPAGTLVGYSTYSMHRRTDYFGADADIYRPERWEHLRPGWEYLPFNGGPRICLGQQYALTEAGYVTVRLVQEFKEVVLKDETGVWVEGLTLTCCSGNGVKVALTPV
ncbi:cytochrome P450 alkane hydroxylase-like protein [Amniculicola lignicola CBS 123094]|uniref:Cytochrome P450 alkane hydroxylase-like protein n=1 Tax=Amniculicola lignicola CBS 123094 TaxID=1392246 RepID=A0A6A5WHM0_9PLEO|nr:cytochrome P450 alkane hydroxylase-like protein [Amniculicola lignicola CBS 123094]